VGAIGVLLLRSANEFRRMARAVDEATQALHQTEIQLIHSEKMAMLGEVVSGIVHEINTPLGYLRSGLESGRENLNSMLRPHAEQTQRLLELLGQASPDPAALREQVARVDGLQGRLRRSEVLEETSTLLSDGIDGVQQINETVVNLLNFSRLGHSRVVRCRVEGGLESTLKLASHFLKTRQVVRRWSETREIECDLSQLNQVFLNVIKNAVQATTANGVITLTTSMVAGPRLLVEIGDNGVGIEPRDLPRVFDAFFTTRADGGGTGLGLSISQKIVHGHGGTIEVRSTPGQGTTFSILLPVKPPASLYAGPAA
jgi:two-component system NtrC family sensor kinase